MSGFAGFVNFDGAPADEHLLNRLTRYLVRRGPDGFSSRISGPAAMCHTLFRTVEKHPREVQPVSLDGVVWIIADARIDGQADLVRELQTSGDIVRPGMSDAELILAAYAEWGEACVDHLIGDFAFAIWDESKQRLLLARDQMGVKPMYYAVAGNVVVFSNSLDCMLLHPAVTDRLNDRAVGDFLLFEFNQDSSTTFYADIHRLPQGHSAVFTSSSPKLRKYWEVPIDDPLYLKRGSEYVDRFLSILDDVVGDRLRVPRVGVSMSGGLDSSSMAAIAAGLLRQRSGEAGVKAFTATDDGYDQEREYAQLVADFLHIPIDFFSTTRADYDPDWLNTRYHTPEPVVYPNFIAGNRSRFSCYAGFSPVMFYGEGPDNALRYEWNSHTRELLKRRRYSRLVGDIVNDTIAHRRIPTPRGLTKPLPARRHPSAYPTWLDPDFERRSDLTSRWAENLSPDSNPHPFRPSSHWSLKQRLWQSFFESFDVGETQALLEVRHPLADVRLIKYLLSVPALPWARNKHLIRVAMRGRLPDRVIARPKAWLVRQLWVERVIALGRPKFQPVAGIGAYVDLPRFGAGKETVGTFWMDFRVPSLNYWLANRQDNESQRS